VQDKPFPKGDSRLMKFAGKRKAATLLPVVIALVLVAAPVLTGFTDIENHWAQETIEEWTEAGLISGYEDGTFRPERQVTRAEFTALVNRSFGFTDRQENHFVDVPLDAWFASHVDRAVAAGYISGYDDGNFRPQEPISRQEAATIVYRLDEPPGAPAGTLEQFADADVIPEWSRDFVAAVVEAGLMHGYDDDTFRPEAPITRAESVATLDRMVAEFPVPDFDAELKLDQEQYHPGDTVTIIVVNKGQTDVQLGHYFEVEFYDDGEWTEVVLDLVWPDVIEIVEPGHDFQQNFVPEEAFQEETEPGRYRVEKEVHCAETGSTMILQEEFRILDDFGAELTLARDAYIPSIPVVMTVTNTGQTTVLADYVIEVDFYEDEKWVEVPLDRGVRDKIVELKPGEEFKHDFIPIADFQEEPEAGRYRVSKEVECAVSGRTMALREEFRLAGNSAPSSISKGKSMRPAKPSHSL